MAAKYLRQRLPIVNPDVIAFRLNPRRLEVPAILEAGKIAIRERTALLDARQSFAIETTLSGNSEIRLMSDASSAGYKVNLVYVGLDLSKTSLARVTHRVTMGEHSVPPEDILRRYPCSLKNLAGAMRLATRTLLIDNSGRGFRLLMIREAGRKPIVARMLPTWAQRAVPQELR